MEKMRLNVKDLIYLLIIIGSNIATYYVNKGKTDSRLTVIETKLGDHDIGAMSNKIDQIYENSKISNDKLDNLTRTIYELTGAYKAAIENR